MQKKAAFLRLVLSPTNDAAFFMARLAKILIYLINIFKNCWLFFHPLKENIFKIRVRRIGCLWKAYRRSLFCFLKAFERNTSLVLPASIPIIENCLFSNWVEKNCRNIRYSTVWFIEIVTQFWPSCINRRKHKPVALKFLGALLIFF